ncbi:MAG: PIG-L family deacetylase [Candidatus Bipolaricaulota bacterium]|nr:PIG-L family deacetylase [Candidatus Bipolaricaulota bacterium]MDW8141131.1 PIG-L family deacetylase [Candidatus Bipolaricaulota bacterium]
MLAPHPDDEVLAAGGAIQEHLRKKHIVKVVLATLGDGQRRGLLLPKKHFLRLGERRYRESLAALELLGVHRERVIALGYPDRGLAPLWQSNGSICSSRYTKVRAVPYEFARTPHALYTKAALLAELQEIFCQERPEIVYLPHPRDRHRDHQALYLFAEAALHQSALHPQRRYYLIHYAGWPLPAGRHPQRPLTPPRRLRAQTWLNLELRPEQLQRKCEAIARYRSQIKYFEENLFRFARRNELFALHAGPTHESPSLSLHLPRFLAALRPARNSDRSRG